MSAFISLSSAIYDVVLSREVRGNCPIVGNEIAYVRLINSCKKKKTYPYMVHKIHPESSMIGQSLVGACACGCCKIGVSRNQRFTKLSIPPSLLCLCISIYTYVGEYI